MRKIEKHKLLTEDEFTQRFGMHMGREVRRAHKKVMAPPTNTIKEETITNQVRVLMDKIIRIRDIVKSKLSSRNLNV